MSGHMQDLFPCPLSVTATWYSEGGDYDGIVLVAENLDLLNQEQFQPLKTAIENHKQIDATTGKGVVLIPVADIPGNRLLFSPTGPTNRDYDDYRSFADAAGVGIQRAINVGMTKPFLVVIPSPAYPNAIFVGALGALQVLYVPLEIREAPGKKATKLEHLTIYTDQGAQADLLFKRLKAIESGRCVARDIGGSDPERMAPPRVAAYMQQLFSGTSIKVDVIEDDDVLVSKYPLFSAVNRCAKVIERHRGRIVKLEYVGAGAVTKTLMLVGKGVTYDTGGADIKAGGIMAGMHRDKCGAAAVAGFFQTLHLLQPQGIKVVGTMAMVRNSVGANGYVADEIITSRAGVRIRIGNTDAEGRMAMGDCLCEMKERAQNEVNPQLMTIATLTGHAVIAMGPKYSIIMDNGAAKKLNHAGNVQTAGDWIGDPFEISNIRREDYEFHKGKSEYEDVLQCNNAPSSRTPRGHQSPAAFMIMASGLDKYGLDSDKPLAYSHIDIAGSSGPFPGVPTGAPIAALASYHLGLQ